VGAEAEQGEKEARNGRTVAEAEGGREVGEV